MKANFCQITKAITFILFCVIIFGLSCQQPFIRQFTTKEGLPSNKVYAATQDKAGFIWLATDNGVSRFDGQDFRNFTVKDGLPDNDVFGVFADVDDRVWILCFKQAPCFFYKNKLYTTENDTFLKKYFGNSEMFKHDVVYGEMKIFFSHLYNGRLLISEYNKIHGEIPSKHKTESFSAAISENIVYIYTNMYIYNLKFNSEKKNKNWSAKSSFRKLKNSTFLLTNPFSGKSTIYKKDTKNDFSYVGTINNKFSIGPFFNFNSDMFFFNNNNQLFKLNNESLLFDELEIQIPPSIISNLWVNVDKSLSITTLDQGFYLYNYSKSFTLGADEFSGLKCIAKVGNRLFTGNDYGILEDISRNKKTILRSKNTVGLKFNSINGIIQINDFLYFGGDMLEGLGKFSMKSNKITYFGLNNSLKKNLNIKDLELSYNNNLLFGSAHGAGWINEKENSITETIWNTRTVAINQDINGTILLGTVNGLYFLKSGEKKPKLLLVDKKLQSSRITDIKTDKFGNWWVGTAQYGLFLINNFKIISNFTDDSPIFEKKINSYYVRNLYIDNKNTIWVASDKGLNKIIKKGLNSYVNSYFNFSEDLPDNNLNCVTGFGDTIYVASSNSIFMFIDNQLQTKLAPGLEITEIYFNAKRVENNLKLLIPYKNNSIVIHFSAIEFNNRQGLIYHYRLNKTSPWQVTYNNKLEFSELSPGDYEFEVYVFNSLNSTSSEHRILKFLVIAPWYKTWFFYGILFLIIILIIYILVKFRLNQQKAISEKEKNTNKKLSELELQAMRSQMNPHFIFNALTAIQNYFINHKEEDANYYMSKFGKLIRQMLVYSKDNFIRLDDEIDLLTNYLDLEKLRFEGRLLYNFNIDHNLSIANVYIPSLILQPLIENSINHGIRPLNGIGIIEITFREKECYLEIDVKDNGVGYNKSIEQKVGVHKSKGLEMLINRLNTLKDVYNSEIEFEIIDLNVVDPTKTGTLVKLKISNELTLFPIS